MDVTPLLRLYSRYRMRQWRTKDSVAAQEKQLLRLLKKAAPTRFGKDHRFAEIRSVADYQERVPLRTYEDIWKEYWEPCFPHLTDCTWPGQVRYFAETSGTTTGNNKFIPYSDDMNRSNTRAIADVYVHHLANRPSSRVLAGPTVVLCGATQVRSLAPGVCSGDLTGIGNENIPWWARRWNFAAHEMALESDWEWKIENLVRRTIEQDVRCIAGYPTWLLFFLNRVAEAQGASLSLAEPFPHLELLVHGGVHFGPYRKIFEDLLVESCAESREVYPCSEGFIAIADRGYGEGLRLIVDNGLFFEFVPLEELDSPRPTRHWLADVEPGVNYALVLSTCAGAWSYVIGDTVKFVERNPPRLLVTGRTTYSLSAFGEHLIGAEIEESVSAAAASLAVGVSDYSVSALFPKKAGEKGRHIFIVEFAETVSEPQRLDLFTRQLDAELCKANDHYRTYRVNNSLLRTPRVLPVRPGTFACWMRSRGKMGGQNKVPRIINNQELAQNLRSFASEFRTQS